MLVAVMRVGNMRVRMAQACVDMAMCVRLVRRIARLVRVVVMLVVRVAMAVLDRFVLVLVDVPLGCVEPYAGGHQRSGGQ